MKKLKQLATFAVVSAAFSAPVQAFAQGDAPAAGPAAAPAPGAPGGDTGTKPEEKKKEAKKPPEKLPFHGSALFVDQSVTTQTVGVGDDYISPNPTYEVTYGFKPKWYFYEAENDSFDVGAGFEAVQEMTNSDGTTKERELQFGDISLSATYGHTFYKDKSGFMTRLSGGPRFTFGTSKASRGRGQYGAVGVGLAAVQAYPLAGPESDVFPGGDVSVSASYSKPLTRCTTPCNEDFGYQRQDVGGRTFTSDQLSAGAMAKHSVVIGTAAGFSVLQRLRLGFSYTWVLQYVHPLGEQDSTVTPINGSPITPERTANPTSFRVAPWVLASLDYDLIDEVGLGVGYYNVTSQIGPDATRRNPLWSPDARFYLTVTANLDALYDTVSGRNKESASAAHAIPMALIEQQSAQY